VAKESAGKILSIDGREVQITNPKKLYFSSQIKVTKLELVQYSLRRSGCVSGDSRSTNRSKTLRQGPEERFREPEAFGIR
jgi:bifunctional non-homologous end joining protein LigD